MRLERFLKAEWVLAGTLVAALTPAAAIVNLSYAPICAALALVLLLTRPADYISFTYWAWMLTPLVRRVVDYHSTFHANSIVMTAPLLVTAMSVVGLFSRASVRSSSLVIPYLVYICVVLFGFFIGAVSAGIVAATFDLLNWALPAIFAVYLLRAPMPAGRIAESMFKPLIWGGFVLGAYGIYQYFFLPVWDAKWIIASNLRSIGSPVPRGVRVFGPLNSPGVYAAYMMASILVMIESRLYMKWFAAAPAVIGLILSLVRAIWGGCLVGVMVIITWSPAKKKMRYVMVIALAAALVAPVIALTPIGEAFGDRFKSLNRLSDDSSFLARQELYKDFSSKLFVSVTGFGLAHSGVAAKIGDDSSEAASLDSGLLDIIFTFGLAGTMMLGALVTIVIRSLPGKHSPGSVVAWSVALSGLSCMVFGPMLVGSQGMLVLPMFALATRCGIPISTRRKLRTSHAVAGAG